jgi:hypothetical protein
VEANNPTRRTGEAKRAYGVIPSLVRDSERQDLIMARDGRGRMILPGSGSRVRRQR